MAILFKLSRQHTVVQKNLLRTMWLFVLFAILCSLFYIPCYSYLRRQTHDIALQHYETNLSDNMHMLDSSIEAAANSGSILTSTGTTLSRAFSRSQLDDTKVSATRKLLVNYFLPYEFVSNFGITFHNEPVLDRYMIFYERTPLNYPNYLSCKQEDYWQQFTDSYGVLPETGFSSEILGDYQAITIFTRLSRQNHSYLFVQYSVDALYNLFANDNMLQVCRIAIYYKDELMASNRKALTEKFETLEVSSSSTFNIRIALEIPNSYLARDMVPLTRLAIIFLIVVVLFLTVWVFLFTFAASKPFNQASEALYNTGHLHDEFENMNSTEFLVRAIHHLDSKLAVYHDMIQSQRERARTQILERALYRGLYSEDARAAFADLIPEFPPQWQLALIQYVSESAAIESDAILAALSQYFNQLPDPTYCLPFDQTAILVLLPVTQTCVPAQVLKTLCTLYDETYPVSLSYHLGDVYDTPASLAEAFQQIEYSSIILQMDQPLLPNNQAGSINMHQLQTIYYALQSGDYQTAVTALKNGTATFLNSRDRLCAKYAYRALSYMLLELELENRNLSDISIPAFSNDRFIEVFRIDFPACFRKICDRLLQDRAAQAQSLESEILTYIDENYSNQQLSITVVTDHFHISAPTLQKRMNAAAGKTFSAYVEEVRMNHARQALLHSNRSIQEISESIGYTNTNSFYKAYRRIFGESPRSTRQGCDT